MSKGKMPIPEIIYLVIGVVILFILVSVAMKIPVLGDWITNFLKGLIKPEMTAEELGIALNSMEALRFAIDVVANDGNLPTAMVVAGVPSEEKKPVAGAPSGEKKPTCEESFKQYENRQIVDVVTKRMNDNGYTGSWTLKIGSIKGIEVCKGTTQDDCGTRTDDEIIKGWCGGVTPTKPDGGGCKDTGGIEKQRIKCTIDSKWYWVNFNAELVKGSVQSVETPKPTCSENNDCPTGKICRNGECITPPTNCPSTACDVPVSECMCGTFALTYTDWYCCAGKNIAYNIKSACQTACSSLPTGGFLLTIKNKITGMAAAGEKTYYGCKYTESTGKIEASCKHDSNEGKRADSVKVECSLKPTTSCNIIGFELPEPITNAENAILGWGDPRFLGYWQKFPMGEEAAWEGVLTWEENVGMVFLYATAITAPGCILPLKEGVIKSKVSASRLGKLLKLGPKQQNIYKISSKDEWGKALNKITQTKYGIVEAPELGVGYQKAKTFSDLARKEQAEVLKEFMGLKMAENKLELIGVGLAGGVAGGGAVVDWLDSRQGKYEITESNSLLLLRPGKNPKAFPLSEKAKEYFVMLDKPGELATDTPAYFGSPCKIDVGVSKAPEKTIGCGRSWEKEPPYDYCCYTSQITENKLEYEYYWSQSECNLELELSEEDTTKCGEKPVVKQEYFVEDGLSNYCIQPTGWMSADTMKTIIVRDVKHYTDKDYKTNNFCYTTRTEVGTAVMGGAILLDLVPLSTKTPLGCLAKMGISFGGAYATTKAQDIYKWPNHAPVGKPGGWNK